MEHDRCAVSDDVQDVVPFLDGLVRGDLLSDHTAEAVAGKDNVGIFRNGFLHDTANVPFKVIGKLKARLAGGDDVGRLRRKGRDLETGQSDEINIALLAVVLERAFCDDDRALHAVVVAKTGVLSDLRKVLQCQALACRRVRIHRVGTIVKDGEQLVYRALVGRVAKVCYAGHGHEQ